MPLSLHDISGATKAYKDEIEELRAKNDTYAKTVGQLAIARDFCILPPLSTGIAKLYTLIQDFKHNGYNTSD